jgi:predicted TIM-barrel fold metal-dependent hydrolase
MQIVDPHIHLWDLETHHYPWLKSPGDSFIGDYRAIARTHRLADFLAETGSIEVRKVVHIDAGHDPADPVAETRWLQSVAADPSSGGMPNGIVAAVDLSRPDAAALLDAHRAASPNLRGVRQILNVHADKRLDYVGRHFMREDAWRAHFKLLRERDLSFDLQIYPSQMREAAALAADNPDTPLILNHTGMFADRTLVAGWAEWRDGLRALAACPNVAIKLSGLGMLDHHWTIESLRPYVLEAIDAFGTGRAMFASNFPVDRLFGTYEALWQAYAAIVAGASEAEKAALFSRNSESIYRI